MPKFNLKLSKTLISNFAYVYSERRKLVIFIFFQKFQFGIPISKFATNSPISPIFGHVTIVKLSFCFVCVCVNGGGGEGGDSFCSSLVGSLICSVHTFYPGLKPLEIFALKIFCDKAFRILFRESYNLQQCVTVLA